MKIDKKALLIPAILVLALVWAYIIMEKGATVVNWLDLLIICLIIVLAVVSLLKALFK